MAERNPWRSNTLEWTTASPPPHGNFAALPTVYRGPYEYSHPDRDDDMWPQDEPPPRGPDDDGGERVPNAPVASTAGGAA